jgi:Sec-independent protein secretion pathway component TatC
MKTKLISINFFVKFRREFIFFFIFISCLLLPPDFLNQVLVFLPCCFLYEILIIWFIFCNNFKKVARMGRGKFAKL